MITVRVIKKDESVIYDGHIYRFGNVFDANDRTAESLIERGYVVKVSESSIPDPEPDVPEDTGTFSIVDSSGNEYGLTVGDNGGVYLYEKEVN